MRDDTVNRPSLDPFENAPLQLPGETPTICRCRKNRVTTTKHTHTHTHTTVEKTVSSARLENSSEVDLAIS